MRESPLDETKRWNRDLFAYAGKCEGRPVSDCGIGGRNWYEADDNGKCHEDTSILRFANPCNWRV